jgi:DNA-binding response OmpR family regulator
MGAASQDIRIIVIEDEDDFRGMLLDALVLPHFSVVGAASYMEGYAALSGGAFDVALVDISLPDQSGFVMVEYLRANTEAAIIIVSVNDSADFRIRGYEAGAHNYFTKPVDLRELTAAMLSLARRKPRNPELSSAHEKETGFWLLARASWQLLTPEGHRFPVTAMELQVLEIIGKKSGKTVPRDVLLMAIYGRSDEASSRALDAVIRRLRLKIAAGGFPAPIKTAHATGYCFCAPMRIT